MNQLQQLKETEAQTTAWLNAKYPISAERQAYNDKLKAEFEAKRKAQLLEKEKAYQRKIARQLRELENLNCY